MRVTQTNLITLAVILFTARSFVAQNSLKGYFYGGLEFRNEITRKSPQLSSEYYYPYFLQLSDYNSQTPGIMFGYINGYKWLVFKGHVSYWSGTKSARQYSAYLTSSPTYEPANHGPYNTGDHYYQVWKGFEGKLKLHNVDVEGSIGIRLNNLISLSFGFRRTNEISYNFTGLYYETFSEFQQNARGQSPTLISEHTVIHPHKKIQETIQRKPEAINYVSLGLTTNCKFGKRNGFVQLDYDAPVFQKKIIDGGFVNLKVGIALWKQSKNNISSE